MKRIKNTGFWGFHRYRCGHCREGVGYLSRFCGTCGTPIEWERCPHCGTISESMRGGFCLECGVFPLRRRGE